MKIAGLNSLERRTKVTLIGSEGEAVNLIVTAVPLGFEVDVARDIPAPIPPSRTVSGPKGITQTFDREDSKFKAAEADVSSLQLVAMIHSALRNDPKVTWAAQRAAFAEPIEFYRAIREEMRTMGFSILDWNAIAKALSSLSGMLEKKMEEAAQGFLPAAPTGA